MATDYTVAYVSRIPNCDLHSMSTGETVPAEYDAQTSDGRWASVCQEHFELEGSSLGLGKGQRYILGEPPVRTDTDRREEARRAVERGDLDAFFDACGDGDPMDFLDY